MLLGKIPKVLTCYSSCLLTLKNLTTLHTLYKVSWLDLLISNISLCTYIFTKSSDMLNENILAVKKCANQKQHCKWL